MKQKKVFDWKMKSFAKGINPSAAAKEFKRIEKEYGQLKPEHIVDASKNKKALFHQIFDWDDAHAAQKYRMDQARTLLNNIEIIIISDGIERSIPAYEIIKKEEGNSYKRIDTFTEADKEQVKNRIICNLNAFKSQLSIYKEFDFAVLKLDETIEVLSNA